MYPIVKGKKKSGGLWENEEHRSKFFGLIEFRKSDKNQSIYYKFFHMGLHWPIILVSHILSKNFWVFDKHEKIVAKTLLNNDRLNEWMYWICINYNDYNNLGILFSVHDLFSCISSLNFWTCICKNCLLSIFYRHKHKFRKHNKKWKNKRILHSV